MKKLNLKRLIALATAVTLVTLSGLAISKGKPAEDKADKNLNQLKKQWYLSNSVSVYDDVTGNTYKSINRAVLGKLAESSDGYDKHDIRPYASMANSKAAVLFIQENWGEHSGEFHSDYRGLKKRRDRSAQSDSWVITVVSIVPGAEVTLKWNAVGLTSNKKGGIIRYKDGVLPEKILKKLHLIDQETKDEIEVVSDDGQLNSSYTFTMDSDKTSRQFRWVYGNVNASDFNSAGGVKQFIAKQKAELKRKARKAPPSDKFGLPPV
ncbi:hypothetical protein [Methyloprofundus sp.]|uniref:hypothetical protein n=1 Tax=Methyloprofundus sp. TaxID=2020875 RepID=UPI003D150C19